MSIILNPLILKKNQRATFSVSKATLAAHPKVQANSYFSDTANWKQIVLRYQTDGDGPQSEPVIMDASLTTPIGEFFVSEHARETFHLHSIVIKDFDGDQLPIYADDLTTETVLLIFTPDVLPPVISDSFYVADHVTLTINNPNSGTTFLKLLRKEVGGEFVEVKSVFMPQGTWYQEDIIAKLNTAKTYIYKAQLVVNSVGSTYSDEFQAIVPAYAAPGPVTNMALAFIPATSEASLMGTAVTSSEGLPITYKVFRSTDNVSFTEIASDLSNPVFTQVIASGVTYYYKMVANNGRDSVASEVKSIQGLTKPVLVLTRNAAHDVLLDWPMVANTQYKLLYGINGNYTSEIDGIGSPFNAPATLFNPASMYTLKLEARNTFGVGSTQLSDAVIAYSAPAPITNLTATFDNAAAHLNWSPVAREYYTIYRGTTLQNMVKLVEGAVAIPNADYVDATSVAGTIYYYGVSASYFGRETTIATVSVKTMNVPVAPSVVTDGVQGVIVTFPVTTGAEKYDLQATDGVNAPLLFQNVQPTIGFAISNMVVGSYEFKVIVSNTVGGTHSLSGAKTPFTIASAVNYGWSGKLNNVMNVIEKSGEIIKRLPTIIGTNFVNSYVNKYASNNDGKKYWEMTVNAPTTMMYSSQDTITSARNYGDGFNGQINHMVTSTSGSGNEMLSMCGTFTTIGSGQSAKGVAVYHNNGAINQEFMSGIESYATGFDVAPTRCAISLASGVFSYYFAGDFTTFNGQPVGRIVRFKATGTIDTTFNCPHFIGGEIRAICAFNNIGNIWVGGSFTDVALTGRPYFVVLDYNGNILNTGNFAIGVSQPNGPVNVIKPISTFATLWIGGEFTMWAGMNIGRLAFVSNVGLLNVSYRNNFTSTGITDGAVLDVAVLTNTKVVAVGSFTLAMGFTRNRIVCVGSNGLEDSNFYSNLAATAGGGGFNNTITSCCVANGGDPMFVTGSFTLVGTNQNRKYFAAIQAAGSGLGSLDQTFHNIYGAQSFNSAPKTMTVDISNTAAPMVYIGGNFTTVGGVSRKYFSASGINQPNGSTSCAVGLYFTDSEPTLMTHPNTLMKTAVGDHALTIMTSGDVFYDGVYISPTLQMPVFGTGTVIHMAIDCTTKKLWVGRNGVWQNGNPATGVGGLDVTAYLTKTKIFGGMSNYLSFAYAASHQLNVTPQYMPAGFSLPSRDVSAQSKILSRDFAVDTMGANDVLVGSTITGGTLKLTPVGTANSEYKRTAILTIGNKYTFRVYFKIPSGVSPTVTALLFQPSEQISTELIDFVTVPQVILNDYTLGYMEVTMTAQGTAFHLINKYDGQAQDDIFITKLEIYNA